MEQSLTKWHTIPGVNIEDTDSYNGTVTDFDGNFIIKAKSNSTLILALDL